MKVITMPSVDDVKKAKTGSVLVLREKESDNLDSVYKHSTAAGGGFYFTGAESNYDMDDITSEYEWLALFTN